MTNYTYVSPQHGTERPETYNHIHAKLCNINQNAALIKNLPHA